VSISSSTNTAGQAATRFVFFFEFLRGSASLRQKLIPEITLANLAPPELPFVVYW
jgi:hypothetical protein